LQEELKSMKTSTEKNLSELAKHIEASNSSLEELDEKLKSETNGLHTSLE